MAFTASRRRTLCESELFLLASVTRCSPSSLSLTPDRSRDAVCLACTTRFIVAHRLRPASPSATIHSNGMRSLVSLPPNILDEICSHLVADASWGWQQKGAPGLVALSVTCKLLSEHALNALWGTLPSLIPLLCTLPSDLLQWSRTLANERWGEVDVLVRSIIPFTTRLQLTSSGRTFVGLWFLLTTHGSCCTHPG